MKKIISLILVSMLGGFFTLGAYKIFIEKSDVVYEQSSNNSLQNYKASYTKSSGFAAETTDFTEAAEKTLSAVVFVKNKSVYITRNPMEEYLYGRSSARQHIQVGTGSGVIISADGYIVTNNHVIENATEIEITLNDKKTYEAKLIGTDPANDIALLKIDAIDLPYVAFANSDHVKVGEWVLAVGNPFNLTATVTAGIVSAKGRDVSGGRSYRTESYIQTDAVVNPGNSGGALVNTKGELIGINTMISSTTGSYIGYSFAVPSNIAKKVIEDIMEYGDVQRAFIGINFRELNGDNRDYFKVDNSEGIIVTNVIENTGASEAGVEVGDVIVKADNVKIATFADLSGFLNTKRPDDIVDFAILRDGKERVIPVKLFSNTNGYQR